MLRLLGRDFTGVSKDSRTVKPGELYVALRGEKFDGHDYVAEAAERGAACALVEYEMPVPEGFPLIRVASAHQALLDLAAEHRRQLNARVIAVTGSAGKTSTKDMTAAVLSRKYDTRKTERNLNNTVGLPMAVLALDGAAEAAVLEMGMNHFGEIRAMSLAAKPDIAMITNIGDAHIENLGSREGVLQAKLEILDGMGGGIAVLNGDDPLLAGLADTDILKRLNCAVFTCTRRPGDGGGRYVYASGITPLGLAGTRCTLHMDGTAQEVWIPQPGIHMVQNALLAAAAGWLSGLSGAEIAGGISDFVPAGGRMSVIKANGFTILNDSYNANPSAMRAVIAVLAGQEGRRVCVLGDMLELGEHAPRLHETVGAYAAEKGIDALVAVGTLARHIYRGYKNANGRKAFYFEDKQAFIAEWRGVLAEGGTVLVKASRGMAFEDIVTALGGNIT